ncbi:MAG: FKBP-type peptidyl-prolyl cis-trans isomerase [Bacteroidia bacterium]
MKKSFIYLGVVVAAIFMASCKKGFQKTEGGLEYKIYTGNSGPKPKEGDIMRCDIIYKKVKNDSDSVFFSSVTRDTGAVVKLSKPTCKGCIEEGMMLLSAGDSATFIASADSFFTKTLNGQELPPFFKKGDKIKFEVKMHSIMSEAQRETMLKGGEKKKLDEYIAKNNITIPPTENGLYYIETAAGTGVSPMDGDSVKANYEGKFLDGKVFDASARGGGPITFILGQMQVIPGWEQAFKMMKEGGKATLIIPSSLAYGAQGYPPVIPPSSPLVFDVELVKVIKGKAATVAK